MRHMGVGGGGGEAGGGHKAGEEGGGTGLTPCLQIQKLQVAWGRPSLDPRSQIPHPHHLSLHQRRDSPMDWNPLKAPRQIRRAPGVAETHQSCGQPLWLYSPRLPTGPLSPTLLPQACQLLFPEPINANQMALLVR